MNSVNIIGFLRENIDATHRVFEYELPFLADSELPTKIVVKYWTNQESRVNSINENARVAISGHLDCEAKFGTIIVVEDIQRIN